MDRISPEARSRLMAKVKGRDTKPELVVRRYLHAKGLRYTLHKAGLPGKPDVVLPKWKAVVLVHGCFWHGHRDCSKARIPKTRPEFWSAKQEGNRARDARVTRALRGAGWRVFTVWQCGTQPGELEKLYRKIVGKSAAS